MTGMPRAVHVDGKLTGPDGEREIHITKTFHPEHDGAATIHGDLGDDTIVHGTSRMRDGQVTTSALLGPDINEDPGPDNVHLERFLSAEAAVIRGNIGRADYESTYRWGGLDDAPGTVFNDGYILVDGSQRVTFERATQITPEGGTEFHGRFGNLTEHGESYLDPEGRPVIDRTVGPYHLTERIRYEH